MNGRRCVNASRVFCGCSIPVPVASRRAALSAFHRSTSQNRRALGHVLGHAVNRSRRTHGVCNAQKQQFSSFEDLLAGSELPVLVDFYATWCGPCVVMSKTLEEAAPELKGQVRVVKIDVDKYPKIASQFGVEGLPTVMLFKNGQPADRFEGCIPAPQLVQRVRYFTAQ